MTDRVVEIKAFVPARDYALSLRFYADMGFTLASDTAGVAYFLHGNASFLLQDFYDEAHARNFMMHLLVEDVDAWWQRLHDAGLAQTYGVRLDRPELRPWGMRDFVLTDPSGVLWRIAQNVPTQRPSH
ncbi:VOC family protein [Sphaerotilus sp.]|uniref:VOC family protein n=1 Tax=Sphaerotilus sp. TaxID=2093942 RepID=UPI002ACD5DCF|nr:VOC family protein [Sphaerotilus sp.]MDZ7855896.1 VOC family protein [Sphaerotilus sp.]